MSARLEKLKAYLKQDPEDDFILFAIAQEYYKLDDLNRALSFYEQLQIKNPDYIGTYYHLGKLHQELEDFENALSTYEEGIKKAILIKDMHALAELQNAKTNLEMEML